MIIGNTHKKCINHFHNSLDFNLDILNKVVQSKKLRANELISIYELTFLQMFISFEGYLESSFMCYLMGKKSIYKYSPKIRIKPKSKKDAINIIHGKPISNTEYIEWSNIKSVAEKSKVLWGKEETPYTKLLSSAPHYKHMKNLRNAIAHLSLFHNDSMEIITRQYLTTNRKTSPGKLLKAQYSHNGNSKELIFFFKDQLNHYADIVQLNPNK